MANPDLLIRPFIRREAALSSRIEGTQANVADLYAYEAGQLPLGLQSSAPEADVREVYNYVQAMEYGLERIHTLPASLRLIRELHERLLHGVRGDTATPGQFRRSQNWIGAPGSTLNEADYVPPPAEELVAALDAFEKYLHVTNSYPPLIRLALIHYQFEAIHPFLDGNGRIGRLLISLLLVDWNLLPLPLLYLSAFFERNRKDYYRLLLAVSERGDWHEWSTFFLQGVSQQAQDAINRAKRLQDLQIEWRRQLQRPGISALLTGIADYLFMQPIISASQVQNQFDVTHPTAMKALRHLVDEGVLIDMTKAKRNQRYIAQRILAIVE